MAAWDFADIYTRSPRALGVYISKIPRSHGITITCSIDNLSMVSAHISSPDGFEDELAVNFMFKLKKQNLDNYPISMKH